MSTVEKQPTTRFRPPRDGLVRVQPGGYEVVRFSDPATPDGGPSVLTGHFAVTNTWSEINSMFEGNFMERLAQGSLTKTLEENGSNIRTTFNHGHDVLGDQVLGRIAELREDDQGAYYEVELFDSVPPLIMDGLRAGQYGASFRFRVMREDINEDAVPSDYNPKGLPERTIREVAVSEFGPVTFPAYPQATAGIRSMTDEWIFEQFASDPERVKQMLGLQAPEKTSAPFSVTLNGQTMVPEVRTISTSNTSTSLDAARSVESEEVQADAPSDVRAAEGHPDQERRDEADQITQESAERTQTPEGTEEVMDGNKTLDELRARKDEIADELARMDADAGTAVLTPDQQHSWDALVAERKEVEAQITGKEARIAELGEAKPQSRESAPKSFNTSTRMSEAEVYDLSELRASSNPKRELIDRVERVADRMHFETPDTDTRNREDLQETVVDLARKVKDPVGAVAKRMILAANPVYERAFWKALQNREMSQDERRAFERVEEVRDFERALGVATTGYAMPTALDPTVLLTSNGAINPLRQISRVVQISGQTWNGVNSAGITASFDPENQEVSDDAPTLTQPTVTVLKGQAFVPYSIESEGWGDIRGELAREIADAKDVLEAQKFTLGTGSPEPQGFTVGATNLATTAGTATIALADVDTVKDALPPRFQPGAAWLANGKFYSKVRQLARTAGVNDGWPNVAEGLPGFIDGKPRYEVSDMVGTVTTSSSLIAAYGDFQNGFLIVDRVGLNVEYVPTVVGSSHRPVGQRGLHAFWFTNSVVRSVAPIRLLKIL